MPLDGSAHADNVARNKAAILKSRQTQKKTHLHAEVLRSQKLPAYQHVHANI